MSAELALRQQELRQIAESNRRRLADILDKATRAMQIQEVQHEVDKASETVRSRVFYLKKSLFELCKNSNFSLVYVF